MHFLFRAIRNFLLLIIIAAFSLAFLFVLKTGELPSVLSSKTMLSTVLPKIDDSCRFPIAYRVGSIDPNFHLSEKELGDALREAEAIWETGLGRDMFVASAEESAIPVSLVFDDRQERTDSLKEASSSIEAKKAIYEKLRTEYETTRKQFERKQASYEASVALYQKHLRVYEARVKKYTDRLSAYETSVAKWNAKGGAPSDEYQKLEDERSDLQKEASALSDTQDDVNEEKKNVEKIFRELNALSGTVNTMAGSLNRLASELNLTVGTYNRVFGTREEFTTGLYTKDADGAKIEVFQFYDRADLVLILAHEMGHALGLGHATEETSIMYPSVEKQKPVLTDEDRKLFESVCKR